MMRTEEDARALLEEALSHARDADIAASAAAADSPEYRRLAVEHLVWVNIAQTLRWVLNELETFAPVQIDQL